MDARLLDVLIGVTGFAILVICLAVLPMVIPATGAAYILAIVIFILFLSGAGYMVNEKIV